MDIASAGSTPPTGSTSLSQATQNAMGQEDFLKLLMAQLEFQDPMSPVENHEFVAQLATFSSLEQEILANERLQELQLGQMSAANAQLSSFIGQTITAQGQTTTVDASGAEPIGLELDADAAAVTIQIKDANGSVVQTIERSDVTMGTHQLDWSPVDRSGQPLPPGDYQITIEATNADGGPVEASTLVTGTVDGVTFENGYPELMIGQRRVSPSEVLTIGSVSPSTTSP